MGFIFRRDLVVVFHPLKHGYKEDRVRLSPEVYI